MDEWIGKPFLLSVNGVECWWIFECIYCLATLDLVLCVSYSRCVGSFQISCAVVWLAWMLVVGIIGFFSQLTLCVSYLVLVSKMALSDIIRGWIISWCTLNLFGVMILGSSGAVLLNSFMVCYLLCLLILLVPTPCSLTHTHTFIFERLLLGFCRLGIFS